MKIYVDFDERWPIAELSKVKSEYAVRDETIEVSEAFYNEFIEAERRYYEMQAKVKSLCKEGRMRGAEEETR